MSVTCYAGKKRRFLAFALILLLVSSTNLAAQERMPPIPPENMTEAQKKAAEALKASGGPNIAAAPWYVLFRVPELVTLVSTMRAHVASRSPLNQKLTELAILVVARQWTQNFEWNIHQPAALKAGLKPEIVTAIYNGRRPEQMGVGRGARVRPFDGVAVQP